MISSLFGHISQFVNICDVWLAFQWNYRRLFQDELKLRPDQMLVRQPFFQILACISDDKRAFLAIVAKKVIHCLPIMTLTPNASLMPSSRRCVMQCINRRRRQSHSFNWVNEPLWIRSIDVASSSEGMYSRRAHFITSNVASAVRPPKSRIRKHFKRQVMGRRPFHPFASNFSHTNYFSSRVFLASVPSPAEHTKYVVSDANNSFIISLRTTTKTVISLAHTFRFSFWVPLEIFTPFLTCISTKGRNFVNATSSIAMVSAVWRRILCKPLLFSIII